MTENPPVIPPPPLSERKNKFQEMARASWLAPLIAIVINFLLMASQGANSGPTNKVQIVVGPLLIFGGLVLGVIALFGVNKYGRQRILVPALIGVGINLLLIVMAALPFLLLPKRAKLQPAVHLPASQVVKNQRLGFSVCLMKWQIVNQNIGVAPADISRFPYHLARHQVNRPNAETIADLAVLLPPSLTML